MPNLQAAGIHVYVRIEHLYVLTVEGGTKGFSPNFLNSCLIPILSGNISKVERLNNGDSFGYKFA